MLNVIIYTSDLSNVICQ